MLSIPHLIIIFIVALAVLGPEKLPGLARTLGKAMADFRRVTGDFRYQIESEMREMDRQTRLKELEQQNSIAAKTPGAPDGAIPRTTAPEGDNPPAVGIVSSDPENPYVQAEESEYTAALNLSAPHAAGDPNHQPVESPAEVAPSEQQK